MRVCGRVFMSRHPVETPMASEFSGLFDNERIRLRLTHLVDPQIADEHVHDLHAVDPAPLGKVVRLAQREAHAMDANSVVLDVVPHAGPLHVAAIARWQDAGTASIWGLSLN